MIAAEPTVPKVIELPRTLPVNGTFERSVESLIVPFNFEPDCVHWTVNVPWKVPP